MKSRYTLPGQWPPAPTPEQLRGTLVIIWGIGKHGGGLAAAQHCRHYGAQVILLDRDQPSPVLIDEIRQQGYRTIQGDLSNSEVTLADWVVVSPAISLQTLKSQPPIAASFTSAEGLFACAHRGKRIAVTGTKGKSTTSHILGTLLNWPVAGNSNQPLLDFLHENDVTQDVVCELSSFQLRYLSCQRFTCDHAVLTTLDSDHLDWHENLAEYHQAKLQLLQWAQSVVIGPTVTPSQYNDVSTSLRVVPNYEKDIQHIISNASFSLIGTHNQDNLKLALRIALDLGMTPTSLAQRVSSISPLEHRLEPVRSIAHVSFINDSIATNPLACQAALSALKGPIELIMGGSDKGADFNALFQSIKNHQKRLRIHLIGELAPQLSHLCSQYQINASRYISLESAVMAAYESALQHTVPSYVLLSPACASFGDFEDFAERGRCFSHIARTIGN